MSETIAQRFAGILADELSEFDQTALVRTFAAGAVIFSAGDPGDGFYVIESGQVKISAVVGAGDLRALAMLGAGDCFGEMAVLDDAPRSATATAEVETKTVFLARDRLLALLVQRPPLALKLIREFSARMRTLNQKYLDEIIQAERLATVGRFARTIVHDFKNPLTTISLASEIAGAEHTSPALRQRAQIQIERQIGRMSNMLNELIEFTRPTDRRPALVPTDLATYLAPLFTEIRDEIAPREVSLEITTPIPAVEVRLQPARLSRLFYNLVNNAVDVMPRGGKIFIQLVPAADTLRVEIEDTGPGIAPEIAQQLFQPFATHGKSHGTGLGLSIAKKIAEDHGGRIWAESTPGRGAKFCFTLPLGKVASP